jgi:hypothetical protein
MHNRYTECATCRKAEEFLLQYIEIRNNLKVLKSGAGGGWRRSVGPIM